MSAYTTVNICTCTYRGSNQQPLSSSEGAGSEGHVFFCGSLLVFIHWDNPSTHRCLSYIVTPSAYHMRPQSILCRCIFTWYHHVMSNKNTSILGDTALEKSGGDFAQALKETSSSLYSTVPKDEKSEPFLFLVFF